MIIVNNKWEIVAADLFDSMAKCEQSPLSDIDIAILTRNTEQATGLY